MDTVARVPIMEEAVLIYYTLRKVWVIHMGVNIEADWVL